MKGGGLTAILMAIGMLLETSLVGRVDAKHVVTTQPDSDHIMVYESATFLQRLLVREDTRDIFIGGINRIERLSPTLQRQDTVETGPRTEGSLSIDHHSKGLILDLTNGHLLACGNLNQGNCFKHSLEKLGNVTPISFAVVGSSVNPTFAATVLLKDDQGKKLVVATSLSQVNGDVPFPPLLSTRDINSLRLVGANSQWKLRNNVSNFEVVHRTGFVRGHFAYILSARPAALNSVVFSSHISRVCIEDKKYRSLVEAPLLCEVDGVRYNVLEAAHVGRAGVKLRLEYNPHHGEDLLYAVFSKSHPAGLTRTQRSALCVFNLNDIEQTLQGAILKCFGGDGHLGPAHFWKSRTPCIQSDLPVDGNYCGEYDLNFPVESSTNISPVLSKAFDNTQLSAVVSSVVSGHTVVYLGSAAGQLLKVELTKERVLHYQTVPVTGGHPILPDIYLTPDESHLYLLSTHKVMRMKVSSCDSSVTCDQCLTSADPHCGWCLSTNRCMSESVCQMDGLAWGWLQTRQETCPHIESVHPQAFHENTTVVVTVGLSFVPPVSMDCFLRIGVDTQKAAVVTRRESGLTCESLQVPNLPPHTESANMSLELHLNHTPWLITDVFVYTCSLHTSCTKCRSSVYCDWCIESSRCTQVNTCPSGPVIHPQNGSTKVEAGVGGGGQCPQIKGASDLGPLIHSGAVGTVHLIALHLPQVIRDSSLTCHLGSKTVNATLGLENNGESLVTCGKVMLFYAQDSASWSAPLAVSWGPQNHRLDNPDDVQLRVYNCKYMVTSCGQCLALDSRYGCSYCDTHCSTAANCATTWRNNSYVCPNPTITRGSPLFGPLGGGTRLTVHGINLGNSVSDIIGGVTVAGEPCTVLQEHFEPSTSFICVTGRSNRTTKGSVQVNVSSMYSTKSGISFTYMDPVLESMEPRLGPESGGTNITLRGRHLDVGTSVSVTFRGARVRRQADGHTRQAHVYSRDRHRILIQSPKQDAAQDKSVYVTIDGNDFLLEGVPFTFVLDPTVTSVSPLVTTLSGGNQVEVSGARLDAVQDPRLVVYAGTQQVTSQCEANTTTQMTCIMPDLAGVNLDVTMNNPKQLPYGFIMDGVTSLLNVTNNSGLDPFVCYADPSLTPLVDGLRYNGQEVLVISGKNLRVLEKVPGGKVLVGGSPCRTLEVNDTNLSCTPPKEPLELSDGSAEVVVVLNGYRGSAGWLGYKDPSILGGKLPLVLGVVLGVAVPIIIVIIVILCRLCRQNKSEQRRQEKLRQSELDIEDPAAMPLTQLQRSDDIRVTETMPLKTEVLRSDEDGAQSEEDVMADRSEDGASQDGELLSNLQVNDVVNGITDKHLRNTVQEVLIERNRLNLGDVLGKGHFGCVYAGTLAPKDAHDSEQRVAVKTLQGRTFDQDAVESFLEEGVMMRNFDHPHVLRLLGVCLPQGGYPMVILPFMANGDLRNYVKNKERSFTARQLLHLAQQVAEGMAYLASSRFVHRDLAARNCMIDDTTNVKVADFGLSKDLYERDYYSGKDRRKKMPIKWMAIESLEEYLFTTKSDVWSFGILMWELLTRGVTPYPDVDIFEIRNYLATGRRLRQPKFCPDNVYAIMVECWKAVPTERPTFADLVNRLELIINPPKKRESSESFDEPLYVNIKRPVSESDCLEKGQ